MTDALTGFLNAAITPPIAYASGIALMTAFLAAARRPGGGRLLWTAGAVLAALFALSMFNDHFRAVAAGSDNIAVLLLIALTLWMTAYALRRAYGNDRRRGEGRPVLEGEQRRRVMVWPNLLFIEIIAALGVTALLLIWSLAVPAPLEGPADPNVTLPVARAPWYFLGLQEMLVYFDPWLAGVVFPALIILGLMALPYLDMNPLGNGYYTLRQRPVVIPVFLFGFLIQGILLIVLATFLRGPGWAAYGPFETWDIHKATAQVNVNLSDRVWIQWLKTALPRPILLREAPGILLVIGYFLGLPFLLRRTLLKRFALEAGPLRWTIAVFLLLLLLFFPLKMALRWVFHLKYLIALPEYLLNL